jgi:demethylmenaquinone methyltransferase/2-methoxy-6-polyprenyl-1,4-benzoquinol methylase
MGVPGEVTPDRRAYRWFYDHIHCHYYNALLKWCFLPFGGEQKVRRTLIEGLPLRPGDRILDMCCGTGGSTFALAEAVGERSNIKGVDLSTGQIRIARRQNRFANIELLVMDASRTAFRDVAFDAVVIPHALHEMPRSTRHAVLQEAWRLLVDGGLLVVLEMDTPSSPALHLCIAFWWFYWLPFNVETPTRRDMLRRGVAAEVEAAGFSNVTKLSVFSGAFQVVQGRKAEAQDVT